MLTVKASAEGLSFKIYVQPRSSRNQVAGLHGDALKLKITSPPVEGAANNTCIGFLAKLLDVPKTRLEIVAGQKGRMKRILVKVAQADQAHVKKRIASLPD